MFGCGLRPSTPAEVRVRVSAWCGRAVAPQGLGGGRDVGVAMRSHGIAVGSTRMRLNPVDRRPVSPGTRTPLVVAKTARPQMVRGGVDRPRLFHLLDRATRNPLTVVRAGP